MYREKFNNFFLIIVTDNCYEKNNCFLNYMLVFILINNKDLQRYLACTTTNNMQDKQYDNIPSSRQGMY